MKCAYRMFVFVAVAAALLPAGLRADAGGESRACATKGKGAVVPEQALEGFFAELDAKSTSLTARREEEPGEVPVIEAGEAILARMTTRLARIDALRARGAVGETNRGFLEERGTVTAQERGIVSEENADRTAVYEGIAALAKVHVDEIGRVRAKKLSLMSKRRAWVQDPDGQWRQKL